MATVTTTGYLTSYVTGTGPAANISLGSPTINPSSTSAPSITFDESLITHNTVPTGAPTSIGLGTIAEATLIYVGCTTSCTLTLVPTATVNLDANGFMLISGASITSLSIEADAVEADVSIAIFGA